MIDFIQRLPGLIINVGETIADQPGGALYFLAVMAGFTALIAIPARRRRNKRKADAERYFR